MKGLKLAKLLGQPVAFTLDFYPWPGDALDGGRCGLAAAGAGARAGLRWWWLEDRCDGRSAETDGGGAALDAKVIQSF
jgi:hypothetical protein